MEAGTKVSNQRDSYITMSNQWYLDCEICIAEVLDNDMNVNGISNNSGIYTNGMGILRSVGVVCDIYVSIWSTNNWRSVDPTQLDI